MDNVVSIDVLGEYYYGDDEDIEIEIDGDYNEIPDNVLDDLLETRRSFSNVRVLHRGRSNRGQNRTAERVISVVPIFFLIFRCIRKMIEVDYLGENQFIIYDLDSNIYNMHNANDDRIFTENIRCLKIAGTPHISICNQFVDAKIFDAIITNPGFACEFVKRVPNISKMMIQSLDNIEDFIMVNNLNEKKTEVRVVVGNIPELTSEHFTNDDIFYVIRYLRSSNKMVCENAKNIIFDNDFPLPGIDFRGCKYDSIDISADNDHLEQILQLATIRKFSSDLACMSDLQRNTLFDILSRTKIQKIVLRGMSTFTIPGQEQYHDAINIDVLLQNPDLENLHILGNRHIGYTKEVLERNTSIKKLVITGPNCDQEFISEICESNQLRRRNFRTKSARGYAGSGVGKEIMI